MGGLDDIRASPVCVGQVLVSAVGVSPVRVSAVRGSLLPRISTRDQSSQSPSVESHRSEVVDTPAPPSGLPSRRVL